LNNNFISISFLDYNGLPQVTFCKRKILCTF